MTTGRPAFLVHFSCTLAAHMAVREIETTMCASVQTYVFERRCTHRAHIRSTSNR
jgi:hypothetical protein